MSDPVVHVTNGIPDSGTGNITTLGQTLVDGANATLGATTDAAVSTDASGTITAFLRGIVKLLVSGITVAAHAVSQSGTWTVQPGNTANTVPWKVDASSVTVPVSSVALGATALDLAPGTGGTRTLRVALDSSQVPGSAYETVAASQTAQVLGSTGAIGDYITGLLITPANTSPGLVTLLDNATTMFSFVGGASSLTELKPFFIPLGMLSVSGAWKVTTGANVQVTAIGRFT